MASSIHTTIPAATIITCALAQQCPNQRPIPPLLWFELGHAAPLRQIALIVGTAMTYNMFVQVGFTGMKGWFVGGCLFFLGGRLCQLNIISIAVAWLIIHWFVV